MNTKFKSTHNFKVYIIINSMIFAVAIACDY